MVGVGALVLQTDRVTEGWWPLLVLAAGATVILILVRRRSRQDGLSPREQARQHRDQLQRRRGVEDDLRDIMLELQNVSRQVNAQLDNKFQRLEAVISDADQRIAALKGLVGGQDRTGAAADVDVTIGEPADRDDSVRAARMLLRRQQVHRLAGQGMTAGQIARQLDQPVGEVELIMALRAAETVGGASS
jgi:hypothetical protein